MYFILINFSSFVANKIFEQHSKNFVMMMTSGQITAGLINSIYIYICWPSVATRQERVKLWKQHFENLLGNPPKVTNEPITRIISKQLDIKLGPFTKE